MGSKWLELVEAMEEKGLRVTFQRKLIAEVFSSTNGFVLPRQIHSYIAKDIPGVSYDTVYRNLRVNHHHHFICLACHKTYPLEFCPIDMGIKTPEAFEVISHKFEIYGYCEECAHGK